MGLQAKTWKNLSCLLKILSWILNLRFNKYQYLTIVIGGFNAKSHNWYKGNKTTAIRSKLEMMTSNYRLTQITWQPNNPTRCSARLRDATLWGSPWPSSQICTNTMMNTEIVRLFPREWSKVGWLWTAK